MPAASIFISYRRDDAAGYARAVGDELARRFGADRVFMDVEDIAAGHAFGPVIERAVSAARVVLVLIGARWAGPRAQVPPRLDDPADLVRREVALALAGGGQVVIPLLLDGAKMPSAAELPAELQALAARHALELHHTRFRADIERLCGAVREALGEPDAAPPRRIGRWLAAAAVLAVAVAAVVAWRMRPVPPAPPPATAPAAPAAAPAPVATVRPEVNGEWQAEVVYDWPNARFSERLVLAGEGDAVHGTASFLGVPRGIEAARLAAGGVIEFITRSTEQAGGATRDTVHRYRGRLDGGTLRFVMQTEGGATAHVPVEFVARRAPR